MAVNNVIEAFGRRLRLAVIGGGPGSFIGPIHRSSALMHERYDVVAGVLSSSPERSVKAAKDLGIPRGYGDPYELIKQEAEREDGADMIAILTPNDSHFPLAKAALEAGLHVVCEKPLSNEVETALELQDLASKGDSLFAIAYCYSAYPMVRQAKAMVEDGILGDIRILSSEYIQGHLADLTETEIAGTNWHMKPEIAGPSLIVGDIATHSYHLINFVSGQVPTRLCADVLPTVPGRKADDYSAFLLRYDSGTRGIMHVTQAAAGAVHGLNFKIYGSKGGVEWYQEQPNELIYRPIDGPMQVLSRGGQGIHPASAAVTHIAIGHPEGYRDAFSNIYYEMSEELAAKKMNLPTPDYSWYPRIDAGIDGVRFVDAAVRSRDSDGSWVNIVE